MHHSRSHQIDMINRILYGVTFIAQIPTSVPSNKLDEYVQRQLTMRGENSIFTKFVIEPLDNTK